MTEERLKEIEDNLGDWRDAEKDGMISELIAHVREEQSELAALRARVKVLERSPTLTPAVRQAVEKAVDYLFVNGNGAKGDRLVLVRDIEKGKYLDLGGWSKQPVIDAITKHLTAAMKEPTDVP